MKIRQISKNLSTICKEGIVRKIEGDEITVEITKHSACEECHAKAICLPSHEKYDSIIAKNLYNEKFEIGEAVTLVLRTSLGLKAVIIGYLLPFIVLMTSLLICYAITKKELISVLVSLACTVLYYFTLKFRNKKLEQKFAFFVHKKRNI